MEDVFARGDKKIFQVLLQKEAIRRPSDNRRPRADRPNRHARNID
jgi:hypothetical protein